MNYILMNKNTEVLKFSYDQETHTVSDIIEVYDRNYAPIGILEFPQGISRKAFNSWWRDRAIPASRSKFKELLETMEISSSIELLEKCFGLSLSDQYWIKEEHSSIIWGEINFFEHSFSEDMGKLLMGQAEYSDQVDVFSPDNSSDGNLRKKWKIIDGKRCLLKGGNSLNNQEPFNEVIATKLLECILEKGEYVPYTLFEENGNYYSCCETMVSTNEELVPAFYVDKMKKLRGSESLYEHYVGVCEAFGIKDARTSIDKMIVCDYIIGNYDRHYRNFGLIRDVETLDWLRIAPLYDSGSSLWATTPTQLISSNYKSRPFVSNPDAQLNLIKDLSWIDVDKFDLFENEVKMIFEKNPLLDDLRIQTICDFVHLQIQKIKNKKAELLKRSE